jgi:hypothetical protein
MAVTMGVLTGVLSVATILFGAGIFTSDIRVHAEMAKLVVPVFLSCLLIIPSRTLQVCTSTSRTIFLNGSAHPPARGATTEASH